MKKFGILLSFVLGSLAAHATIDYHTRVYIVVQDVQTEEFFVERAPVIGCMGLAYGAQLEQFTSEYNVKGNIGCGGEPAYSNNINYLTCAKVVETKESSDYVTITDLKLDISNCAAKNDPKFITMVRTAAKLNFPQKNRQKEIKLTLVK
jgi:hypothetical protein